MIPTVIINLAKNKERKKTMEEKIQKTYLSNYIYMDAVYGKTELHKYDFEIIPNYIDPYKNTPIYVGIIGCTLSHYCVWNYIVENNIEKLLILEDDTVFYDNFDSMLKYILNLDIHYDMFYLNRHKLNHLYNLGNEIEFNDNIVIPKYCYNASSYILTYNGAKKLLNSLLNWDYRNFIHNSRGNTLNGLYIIDIMIKDIQNKSLKNKSYPFIWYSWNGTKYPCQFNTLPVIGNDSRNTGLVFQNADNFKSIVS
jgi:GR25 family glycosyltransferase involved in LPS biosynthesis